MAHARIDDYFIERFHLLTRNEIIVYCYLVKSKNSITGKCNPKQKTISGDTCLAPSRVSEAVCGLEEKGWAIADENGNYLLPEKVTESVRKVTKYVREKVTNNVTKVTEYVSKSYGIRNKSYGIRKKDKDSLNIQEQTIEQTRNSEDARNAPAPVTESNAHKSEEARVSETTSNQTSINQEANAVSENQTKMPRRNRAAEENTSIAAVFEYWKKTLNHPGALLDHKRTSIIRARLKNFTAEQLMLVSDGVLKSPYHLGINDTNTRYDAIKTIYRDADQVEKFIELAHGQKQKAADIWDGYWTKEMFAERDAELLREEQNDPN